ncbi:mercury transporter MerT [Thermosulfurimonas marina]|uniref:Mercuric transport protein MerT n=1 Tax=Thermosulfurimonas marina TaxID=2047767 RepID=A0A6H1WS96_9BACT|nr:mercuric transporter MerT family protein [Thermosulfurimonas marina]QJA06029.1 mercury transporter MerT [Thermosulfurimonas marina]
MSFKEAAGGLVASVASILAASCCVVPTLFLVFGVSVSGLGFLSSLEPYRPYFLVVGYLAVAFSFYRMYHLRDWFREKILKKRVFRCACEEAGWVSRVGRLLTWVALVLLLVATFYPWALAHIYG